MSWKITILASTAAKNKNNRHGQQQFKECSPGSGIPHFNHGIRNRKVVKGIK